ncbi:MAG: RNA-binding S4 domain-containing protein [Mycoplasmataceae bacterium]|nr:RNA-binding S4 domain-containing protein [Mycoplasmataceae bacterium]
MKIIIQDDSIKVGQLLKKIGAISTGGQARMFLETNVVKVNGKMVETRGTKIVAGSTIWINDDLYQVLNEG